MRLEAAIRGDLHKFMQKEITAAEVAVTAAVTEISNKIKDDLRQQVVAAELGQRLARTWQSKIYPKGKKSIDAAGWVFSKAPKLVRAFNKGALIKSRDGFFLAIPTENAPKRGMNGKRISPSNFPEHSLGRLRFVYRPGQISLLVVDNLRAISGKRGGFRKASETTGRRVATVVMFFLVPQVKLKKRLDYQSIVNHWEPQLSQAILRNWPEMESLE